MEKYKYVSKLTDEYLHGTLVRMEMDYEDGSDVVVSISYKDDHETNIDYRMKFENLSDVHFLSHKGRDSYGKFALSRDVNFESALKDYLVKA